MHKIESKPPQCREICLNSSALVPFDNPCTFSNVQLCCWSIWLLVSTLSVCLWVLCMCMFSLCALLGFGQQDRVQICIRTVFQHGIKATFGLWGALQLRARWALRMNLYTLGYSTCTEIFTWHISIYFIFFHLYRSNIRLVFRKATFLSHCDGPQRKRERETEMH